MPVDLDAAERFVAANARVLDRRRFDTLFRAGAPAAVRDAVAAYRTADGGFGFGLEPDARTPHAQPLAAELALRVLHEAGALDAGLAGGACDWLAANAPAGGGAAAALPTVHGWPHAPWWTPRPGVPAEAVATGQLLGILFRCAAELPELAGHPWVRAATAWMWPVVGDIDPKSTVEHSPVLGYQLLGVARFLDTVPEPDRARRELDRLAPLLRAFTEGAAGDVHGPLGFAPLPGSRLRALFAPEEIERHLQRLAAGQAEDGGWTFDWPAWSPVTTADWRGAITVDTLVLLRANGCPPG